MSVWAYLMCVCVLSGGFALQIQFLDKRMASSQRGGEGAEGSLPGNVCGALGVHVSVRWARWDAPPQRRARV